MPRHGLTALRQNSRREAAPLALEALDDEEEGLTGKVGELEEGLEEKVPAE